MKRGQRQTSGSIKSRLAKLVLDNTSVTGSESRRQALIALLLILLPNLVLVGVGLLMRNQHQQVAQVRAAGRYDPAWFLRMVGLYAFMLLPMGVWL